MDESLDPRLFQYVDVAIGTYKNRNRIKPISEIPGIVAREASQRNAVDKEIYITAYRYTEEALEYVKHNEGSIKGYNAPAFSPYMYLDIDEADLSVALAEAKALVTTLVTKWGINPNWLRYYFSGAKGFHIELRSCWFRAEPHVGFSKSVGQVCQTLACGGKIDLKIYEPVRLFRTIHSVNLKSYCKEVDKPYEKGGQTLYAKVWEPVEGLTPRYKIPLSFDELMGLSVDAIRDLAVKRREDFVSHPDYAAGAERTVEKLTKVWDEFGPNWTPPVKHADRGTTPIKLRMDTIPRDQKVCIQKILHGESPLQAESERSNGLMVLVDYIRTNMHFPESMNRAMMHAFLDEQIDGPNPPTHPEIDSMIDRMYAGAPYDYGCRNPIMASRCCESSACKYWTGENGDKLEDHLFDIDEAEARYRNLISMSKERKMTLGFPRIDQVMGGIMPGHVCLILARSGVGKTSLLLNILRNIAKNHDSPWSLFFTLEQPVEEVYEKMAASVPFMRSTRHVEEEYLKNSEVAVQLLHRMRTDLPHLRFCDKDRISLDQMKEFIVLAQKKYNVEHFPVIAVDYLGRMRGRGKDEYQEISELAKNMKQIAKDLNTVVLLIHQVSREGGGSGEKKLTMTSARGSGQVEEAADFILGLSREDMESESDAGALEYKILAQLLKNRRGQSRFSTYLMYDGPKCRFYDPTDERNDLESPADAAYGVKPAAALPVPPPVASALPVAKTPPIRPGLPTTAQNPVFPPKGSPPVPALPGPVADVPPPHPAFGRQPPSYPPLPVNRESVVDKLFPKAGKLILPDYGDDEDDSADTNLSTMEEVCESGEQNAAERAEGSPLDSRVPDSDNDRTFPPTGLPDDPLAELLLPESGEFTGEMGSGEPGTVVAVAAEMLYSADDLF